MHRQYGTPALIFEPLVAALARRDHRSARLESFPELPAVHGGTVTHVLCIGNHRGSQVGRVMRKEPRDRPRVVCWCGLLVICVQTYALRTPGATPSRRLLCECHGTERHGLQRRAGWNVSGSSSGGHCQHKRVPPHLRRCGNVLLPEWVKKRAREVLPTIGPDRAELGSHLSRVRCHPCLASARSGDIGLLAGRLVAQARGKHPTAHFDAVLQQLQPPAAAQVRGPTLDTKTIRVHCNLPIVPFGSSLHGLCQCGCVAVSGVYVRGAGAVGIRRWVWGP